MVSLKAILRGAINGASFGLVLAFLAILVGLIRMLIAISGGRRFAALTGHDLRLLGFYVGGFIVAGALVGAAGPVLPGRFGTYVRFAIGGIVLMLVIAVADDGSLVALDATEWVLVSTLGVAFGLAGAYGYLKR